MLLSRAQKPFVSCFLTLALAWSREALSLLRLGTVLTLWLRVPPESYVLGLSCLLETNGQKSELQFYSVLLVLRQHLLWLNMEVMREHTDIWWRIMQG